MKNANLIKLKGFRDFLPKDKELRDFVEQSLVRTFKSFNFKSIETPTLEYQSLLLGKYGKEADKLVYKFKDNGDRDVALRYDQTVPTTRFIVENQNELPKYFRRFQIQNVFRSEKPQVGRYREFKQCDIDIFGSKSMLSDAEIIACTYAGFVNLGIKDIKIFINDRELLVRTIKSELNGELDVFSVIQTIDKMDKISKDEIIAELESKGLSKDKTMAILEKLQESITNEPESLKTIRKYAEDLGVEKDVIVFQPFLARGLDYYTGLIYEVKSNSFKEGSLGGGGRYDNLVEQLVGKNVPAVGFAFGFDRVVELIERLNIGKKVKTPSYLMCVFNDSSLEYALKCASNLRKEKLVEVYPNLNDSLSDQLKYALTNNFDFVVIAGSNEMSKEVVVIKNLKTKEQVEFKIIED